MENYTNEWTREWDELETEFTRDSKSYQPPCTEQFPILRLKHPNDDLIDYYLQYQSPDIKNLIEQFDFQCTDLEDEELVILIDMIIKSRKVYSNQRDITTKKRI